MISLLDCAVLAEDVYSRVGNALAENHAWTRIDGQNWANGFAAGEYQKGGERVIAFRGTEDYLDVIADLRMVPQSSNRQARNATSTLARAYGLEGNIELRVGANVLERILAHDDVRNAIRLYGNRVPTRQTAEAISYFDRMSPAPRFVVGHSLGGALAKAVSQHRNVSAIGFNSPFMGDLEGTVPVSSPDILSVNASKDPLSLATRAVGNLSHGRLIEVHIEPFNQNPPRRPSSAFTRPLSCPRASGTSPWRVIADAVCEEANDIAEVVIPPSVRLVAYSIERGNYVVALYGYFGAAAGYYHSMKNLREAIENSPRFRQVLQANLSTI